MSEDCVAVSPCTGHGPVREDSWKLIVRKRDEIESF